MTREQQRQSVLDALEGLLERGGDADDVLREAVDLLAPLYEGVALDFAEEGSWVRGPSRGSIAAGRTWPVRFEDAEVARLTVGPSHDDDRAFLDRVTTLISAHCLVGWDTGGESWQP